MSLSDTTPTKVQLWGVFHERKRTSKAGKVSARTTIEFDTDSLLFELDEMVLGQPIADAVKGIIQDQIGGIFRRVSQATIDRRRRSLKNPGTRSYKKRYSGGRTGEMPPDSSSSFQWGNDSGRLRETIFVRDNPTDAAYTVNVAANRLKRETFGHGFEKFLQDLASLVPALKNPASMLGDKRFEKGVRESVSLMITHAKTKGEAERALRLKKLQAMRLRTLKAGLGLARTFASG